MPRHNSLLERQRLKDNLIDRVNGAESRAGALARQVLTTPAGDGRYFRRHGALDGVAPVFNVKTVGGALGDGSSDDGPAIQTTSDVARDSGGGIVLVPASANKYRCESDVEIPSNVRLVGAGEESHLEFNGASLLVSGINQGAHVQYWGIQDVHVSRVGTAGPAVLFEGDGTGGSNKGAIKFDVRRLVVIDSTGDGIVLRNTYIGHFFNVAAYSCAGAGLVIEADTVAGLVSANNVAFFGGEFQGNARGVDIELCAGVAFYSMAIEGNTSGGLDLQGDVRLVALHNCYFENNSGYDVKVGSAASGGYSHLFDNCVFFDSSAGKNHAIELIRSQNVSIRNCAFVGYTTEAINHNPAAAGAVVGTFENLFLSSTPAGCTNENTAFRAILEERVLSGSVVWDAPSIADGDNATQTVTVTGAVAGDFCQAATASSLQGMTLTAYCAAADTVTLVLANNTGGAVNIGNTTYRAIVIPRGVFL